MASRPAASDSPGSARSESNGAATPKATEPTDDWFSRVHAFGTYGDVESDGDLGDCALAAVADIEQIQSSAVPLPEAPFVDEYDALVRANGESPSSAVGLPVDQVLDAWAGQGIDGSVESSVAVDVGQAAVEAALASGPLYVAISLPPPGEGTVAVANGMATTPWTLAEAPLGYGSAGGHAAVAAGYDARYLYLVTWGYVVEVTWAFWNAHAEGAWLTTPSSLGQATAP